MSTEPVTTHSRPAAERPGTHLVLMLHGYGSHEADLMGLVPALPEDGFTYVGMRAPEPAGGGFQWFALTGEPGAFGFDAEGVKTAADGVISWIEQNAGDYADVTLLGFSQGMSVATSVARHRPDLVRAVVGLSGFAVDSEDEFYRDADLAARSPRMPFFYGRGQEDTVISEEMVRFNLAWLRDYAELTKVVYSGLGHGVNNQEVSHVGEFLRHVMKG